MRLPAFRIGAWAAVRGVNFRGVYVWILAELAGRQRVSGQAELLHELESRLAPLCALPDGTLFFEQSGPHYVTVTKEGDNVLLWLLDRYADGSGVVQSELNLRDPLNLVDPYTQSALLALLWTPYPERIYTTGLGGGSLATALHYHLPNTQIDCIEIDPMVVRAAAQCFGFRTDDRLRLGIDDGRDWLAKTADAPPYDVLILDAFLDNGYSPYAMATREFAELCAQRLSRAGVMVVNLLYLGNFYLERIRSLAAVFEHVYLLSMGEDNDLVFASHSPLVAEPARQAAAQALATRLDAPFPLVERASKLTPLAQCALPGLDAAVTLSDAAPPVRYFDVMPTLTGDDVHWPAERPCLCGSGQQYGMCHGK